MNLNDLIKLRDYIKICKEIQKNNFSYFLKFVEISIDIQNVDKKILDIINFFIKMDLEYELNSKKVDINEIISNSKINSPIVKCDLITNNSWIGKKFNCTGNDANTFLEYLIAYLNGDYDKDCNMINQYCEEYSVPLEKAPLSIKLVERYKNYWN